jgi:hypothetical protein
MSDGTICLLTGYGPTIDAVDSLFLQESALEADRLREKLRKTIIADLLVCGIIVVSPLVNFIEITISHEEKLMSYFAQVIFPEI